MFSMFLQAYPSKHKRFVEIVYNVRKKVEDVGPTLYVIVLHVLCLQGRESVAVPTTIQSRHADRPTYYVGLHIM